MDRKLKIAEWQKRKLLSWWDSLIVALIVIVALSVFLFMPNGQGTMAYIYSDHQLIKSLDLNIDTQFMIYYQGGYNEIQVKNKAIRVVNADCGDGTCMYFGAISAQGTDIVCIPHRLIIRVAASDSDHDIDGVT